jgi:ubiquitin carboxyl-terminal hydrolase L5
MTTVVTDTWQALFNVMLREFGVEGIKVQEVVSLDEGMMALLPYASYAHCFPSDY